MKRRRTSDVLTLLAEMEERADEREVKRMKLEAEIEEKRRQEERKHEERMNTMMMGFMTQIMGMFAPPGPGNASYRSPPPPPSFPMYDPQYPPYSPSD